MNKSVTFENFSIADKCNIDVALPFLDTDIQKEKMLEYVIGEVAVLSSIINSQNIYSALESSERPWGKWYSLFKDTSGDIAFQVKKIIVNPGCKISLQYHNYRSEHWIVLNGIATVTCGDSTFDLEAGQSTYIPTSEIHRLENNSNYVLEIIEIQLGRSVAEDDIIRLEDIYGRI